ncbi:MAG TPA: MFS transporter, partial [Porticoccaceae bacterium]|nr:MFS transporter [Porticoccaceae bacterium]
MANDNNKNLMDAGTIILSAIIISAIGMLFYNLLPMYVGIAQDSKGLDNSQVGFISAAFFLGFNLVTLWAFYWIRKWNWRWVTLVATPIAALGLYASTLTDSYQILLVSTAVSGGAFAAMYGIGTTILSDTSNPARWYGLKIAAEAILGAILLLILPISTIASYGFNGMIVVMLISIALLSPLLFLLPARGNKNRQQEGREHLPVDQASQNINHMAIWSALIGTLIVFSGISAVWAFLERLGNSAAFDPGSIGILLAAALGFATAGSLGAAAIGKSFGNVRPFLLSLVVMAAGLIFLADSSTMISYSIGCCLFALAFGVCMPFAIAEVAELDIDGRYVILSVPAIGTGAMLGPA